MKQTKDNNYITDEETGQRLSKNKIYWYDKKREQWKEETFRDKVKGYIFGLLFLTLLALVIYLSIAYTSRSSSKTENALEYETKLCEEGLGPCNFDTDPESLPDYGHPYLK